MAKKFKKVSFVLNRPVRLAPKSGTTQVDIRTTGCFALNEEEPKMPLPFEDAARVCCTTYVPYSERQFTLCATPHARLSRSPQGRLRTVKVILPWEMASEEQFVREVRKLFRKYYEAYGMCG